YFRLLPVVIYRPFHIASLIHIHFVMESQLDLIQTTLVLLVYFFVIEALES
ncbi:hypothetical protein BC941DRAFT_416346, partial [Chlamydoabsidia padenii]